MKFTYLTMLNTAISSQNCQRLSDLTPLGLDEVQQLLRCPFVLFGLGVGIDRFQVVDGVLDLFGLCCLLPSCGAMY